MNTDLIKDDFDDQNDDDNFNNKNNNNNIANFQKDDKKKKSENKESMLNCETIQGEQIYLVSQLVMNPPTNSKTNFKLGFLTIYQQTSQNQITYYEGELQSYQSLNLDTIWDVKYFEKIRGGFSQKSDEFQYSLEPESENSFRHIFKIFFKTDSLAVNILNTVVTRVNQPQLSYIFGQFSNITTKKQKIIDMQEAKIQRLEEQNEKLILQLNNLENEKVDQKNEVLDKCLRIINQKKIQMQEELVNKFGKNILSQVNYNNTISQMASLTVPQLNCDNNFLPLTNNNNNQYDTQNQINTIPQGVGSLFDQSQIFRAQQQQNSLQYQSQENNNNNNSSNQVLQKGIFKQVQSQLSQQTGNNVNNQQDYFSSLSQQQIGNTNTFATTQNNTLSLNEPQKNYLQKKEMKKQLIQVQQKQEYEYQMSQVEGSENQQSRNQTDYKKQQKFIQLQANKDNKLRQINNFSTQDQEEQQKQNNKFNKSFEKIYISDSSSEDESQITIKSGKSSKVQNKILSKTNNKTGVSNKSSIQNSNQNSNSEDEQSQQSQNQGKFTRKGNNNKSNSSNQGLVLQKKRNIQINIKSESNTKNISSNYNGFLEVPSYNQNQGDVSKKEKKSNSRSPSNSQQQKQQKEENKINKKENKQDYLQSIGQDIDSLF